MDCIHFQHRQLHLYTDLHFDHYSIQNYRQILYWSHHKYFLQIQMYLHEQFQSLDSIHGHEYGFIDFNNPVFDFLRSLCIPLDRYKYFDFLCIENLDNKDCSYFNLFIEDLICNYHSPRILLIQILHNHHIHFLQIHHNYHILPFFRNNFLQNHIHITINLSFTF